jgi:hypothetical protein
LIQHVQTCNQGDDDIALFEESPRWLTKSHVPNDWTLLQRAKRKRENSNHQDDEPESEPVVVASLDSNPLSRTAVGQIQRKERPLLVFVLLFAVAVVALVATTSRSHHQAVGKPLLYFSAVPTVAPNNTQSRRLKDNDAVSEKNISIESSANGLTREATAVPLKKNKSERLEDSNAASYQSRLVKDNDAVSKKNMSIESSANGLTHEATAVPLKKSTPERSKHSNAVSYPNRLMKDNDAVNEKNICIESSANWLTHEATAVPPKKSKPERSKHSNAASYPNRLMKDNNAVNEKHMCIESSANWLTHEATAVPPKKNKPERSKHSNAVSYPNSAVLPWSMATAVEWNPVTRLVIDDETETHTTTAARLDSKRRLVVLSSARNTLIQLGRQLKRLWGCLRRAFGKKP